ncbi:hypothetical protein AGABI1DRAFT_129820 [Agaricus bisporus var. burnettii JB137-S8]|uniref:Major facilitator superfamily (MFS) profile domain-containing protein n=1 Tax=Agaricus bisporus var. burnettii (strain JB137-S8 / ATCC MYA-4627 / FGSC 10392) TaxID=597362 RepID=K5XSU1_AGABU|nr:uncharacterized protein AGABI1DRAFT_129820 [Agaricus bisporus var. burnettii JB137-S8]EKM78040.1 hypothetical protein AGABI1DRAFT_129820 [Agaricus bisporus var. burnettii JB137-S8]
MEGEAAGRSSDTEANSDSATPRRVAEERTPLPVKQLFVIATVLLCEPLTNSIIRSFDDASNVKTVGGLTGQVVDSKNGDDIVSNAYSHLLVSRPFGLGLSTWVLGLTNNTWIQTSARSMQGVFGGNLETTKTVIAEVTDASNRHRAYAALPFVQSVGISIGLSLGNLLANLPERFPFLNNLPFINTHPRLIPCSVAAAFSFISFHVIYHGFEESLPPEFKIDWKVLWNVKSRVQMTATSVLPSSTTALLDQARDLGYNTVHTLQDTAENAISSVHEEVSQRVNAIIPIGDIDEASRFKELIRPGLIIALLNYACISFLDQAQQILVPMVYTSAVDQGGLGLSPEEMTRIAARWGSYNTLGQLLIFPRLLQRYGPKKVYATCLTWMVAFFSLFPVLFLVKTRFGDITVLVSIHIALSSLVYMAYGSAQLLVMEAVSDGRSLGSVNGIAQSVGSSARMIVPPLTSVFFTLVGNGGGIVGGYSLISRLQIVGRLVDCLSEMLCTTTHLPDARSVR